MECEWFLCSPVLLYVITNFYGVCGGVWMVKSDQVLQGSIARRLINIVVGDWGWN